MDVNELISEGDANNGKGKEMENRIEVLTNQLERILEQKERTSGCDIALVRTHNAVNVDSRYFMFVSEVLSPWTILLYFPMNQVS